MFKYIQRKPNLEGFYNHEYWWVTRKDIVGPRLVHVEIPPTDFPTLRWSFRLIHGSADEPYRYENERNEWLWIDYIHEPETYLFDHISARKSEKTGTNN